MLIFRRDLKTFLVRSLFDRQQKLHFTLTLVRVSELSNSESGTTRRSSIMYKRLDRRSDVNSLLQTKYTREGGRADVQDSADIISAVSEPIHLVAHQRTQHSIVVRPTAVNAISTDIICARRSFSTAKPLTWNSLLPAVSLLSNADLKLICFILLSVYSTYLFRQRQSMRAERERSGSVRSSERERGGKRAKSAARNPLHHKTTQSKKFKIDFKSYHETVSVNSL